MNSVRFGTGTRINCHHFVVETTFTLERSGLCGRTCSSIRATLLASSGNPLASFGVSETNSLGSAELCRTRNVKMKMQSDSKTTEAGELSSRERIQRRSSLSRYGISNLRRFRKSFFFSYLSIVIQRYSRVGDISMAA